MSLSLCCRIFCSVLSILIRSSLTSSSSPSLSGFKPSTSEDRRKTQVVTVYEYSNPLQYIHQFCVHYFGIAINPIQYLWFALVSANLEWQFWNQVAFAEQQQLARSALWKVRVAIVKMEIIFTIPRRHPPTDPRGSIPELHKDLEFHQGQDDITGDSFHTHEHQHPPNAQLLPSCVVFSPRYTPKWPTLFTFCSRGQ